MIASLFSAIAEALLWGKSGIFLTGAIVGAFAISFVPGGPEWIRWLFEWLYGAVSVVWG